MRKPLPAALDIDLRGGLTDAVTPHAGSALLIDLGRRSGVIEAAERHLPAKRSTKGLGQDQFVESLVLLSALGGECLDDLARLRGDRGLAALLGYELPAAATARQWLDRFHDPAVLADRPVQGSFIPHEPAPLAGLHEVVRRTVGAYVAAVRPGAEVTLDVDAHLVESAKATALPTYAGYTGYQRCSSPGRRPALSSPTSSATATCPPRSASLTWSTQRTGPCRRATGGSACAPTRPPTRAASSTTGLPGAGASR